MDGVRIGLPRRSECHGTMTDAAVQQRGADGLRSFARLPPTVWTAAAVALLANSADTYALFVLLWIAGPQGWSGAETALIVLALRLPALVSGPLAGRAVDRWGARPIMLVDLAGRGLLVTLMAMSGRDGSLPVLPVLVLGGLAGGLSPATYAAVRSLIPRFVAGQHLGRANAVVALSDQMPLLLGALLVGPVPRPARSDRESARRGDHASPGRRSDPPATRSSTRRATAPWRPTRRGHPLGGRVIWWP